MINVKAKSHFFKNKQFGAFKLVHSVLPIEKGTTLTDLIKAAVADIDNLYVFYAEYIHRKGQGKKVLLFRTIDNSEIGWAKLVLFPVLDYGDVTLELKLEGNLGNRYVYIPFNLNHHSDADIESSIVELLKNDLCVINTRKASVERINKQRKLFG